VCRRSHCYRQEYQVLFASARSSYILEQAGQSYYPEMIQPGISVLSVANAIFAMSIAAAGVIELMRLPIADRRGK
jgi:hypothetical protein